MNQLIYTFRNDKQYPSLIITRFYWKIITSTILDIKQSMVAV